MGCVQRVGGKKRRRTKRGKGMLRSSVDIMREMKSLTFSKALNKHLNCFFFWGGKEMIVLSNSIGFETGLKVPQLLPRLLFL